MSAPAPLAGASSGGAVDAFARDYLTTLQHDLAALKLQADRAVAQVADDDLWTALDAESNSLGVLLRHVAGNLGSRFTDFFSSDGEKAGRRRDDEFVEHRELGRRELIEQWDRGWDLLTLTVAALDPADLGRTVRIRGEALTVVQALQRATLHAAQHVGQIVLLAKHHRGLAWRTLSIPRAAVVRAAPHDAQPA